ncbi:type II toxin-antitoxin system RelE/ParE family toxin [Rufibacter roseolus]|uniref:type II toxin-antitoxin system RelE/ParE family toxin n=1 Tax=Rufibacter roseolus TaxID=2817375 RepID=UPI001B30FCC1|nr:type II toxin-antitoxin system RelE/ParE family toxin [Rufibacter roseolus]
MKLKISRRFSEKLNAQVRHIAQDKPGAARKFKTDIIQQIREIPNMPFRHRKSIFFDQEEIRELVFKGYLVVYRINQKQKEIEVFGFVKYEENPL